MMTWSDLIGLQSWLQQVQLVYRHDTRPFLPLVKGLARQTKMVIYAWILSINLYNNLLSRYTGIFNVSVELVVCMASKVSSALHRVLVLGSGFTSAPLVECLTRDGRIAVTVGKIFT
jgi:hypothetical protein